MSGDETQKPTRTRRQQFSSCLSAFAVFCIAWWVFWYATSYLSEVYAYKEAIVYLGDTKVGVELRGDGWKTVPGGYVMGPPYNLFVVVHGPSGSSPRLAKIEVLDSGAKEILLFRVPNGEPYDRGDGSHSYRLSDLQLAHVPYVIHLYWDLDPAKNSDEWIKLEVRMQPEYLRDRENKIWSCVLSA